MPHIDAERVVLGLDIGGTKANALSNIDDQVYRYETFRYKSPYDVIDAHLLMSGITPAVICLGMAAVRNHDGSMRLVKRGWPLFDPAEAEKKYEDTKLVTANDLITTAVGIMENETPVQSIKLGMKEANDATLIYAWGTGIGAALSVPTGGENIYLPTACGHAGLAPQQEDEIDYLRFVSSQHQGKISTEFAIGGEDGMRNLLAFYYMKNPEDLQSFHDHTLAQLSDGVPIGNSLVEAATHGDKCSRKMASAALNMLGGLLGYSLRNQVLSADVREIKMTGSLSLGLLPYLAENTPLLERFVDKEARCAYIPNDTAIDLVLDPHVAVKGSLKIAEKSL